MISIFFYQTVLFLFFYFFGKKISYNLNQFLKLNLSESEIYTNFLFSIFLLSIISLIINFFIALNDLYIIIIFTTLTIWSFFKVKYNDEDKINIKILIILSILLLPFAINLEIGHDSGLYHLPFQTWIKNYKITFGLAELHNRYALTSIHDYLLSIFWIKNFFTLNAILQSSFIVILFSFFTYFVGTNKNKLFFIYSLPILISFPIWHRYIIFDYGSVDFAFGTIAIILTLQLLKFFNSKNKDVKTDISLLLILFVYAITLKPSGILFSFLVILFIIFLYNKNFLNVLFKTKVKFVLFLSFLVITTWFLRNFIISGCLVYPISLSCFDVAWYNEIKLIEISNQISNYQIHFETIFKYIFHIINDLNIIVLIVLLIFLVLFWALSRNNYFYINQFIILFSIVVIIFSIDFESLRGFSNISSISKLSGKYILRDTIIFNEFLKIILSYLSSICLSIAIVKIYNFKINYVFNFYNNSLFLLLLSFFCIWFFNSPDPRLGFWIFALLPSLFLASVISSDFNLGKINIKIFTLTILFANLVFIFLINFNEINKEKNITKLINHKKEINNNSIIKKREKFGFTPVEKFNENGIVSDFSWNYCWNVVDCYYNPKDASLIKLPLNYSMIVIEKN